jgi:hypothetical protein
MKINLIVQNDNALTCSLNIFRAEKFSQFDGNLSWTNFLYKVVILREF